MKSKNLMWLFTVVVMAKCVGVSHAQINPYQPMPYDRLKIMDVIKHPKTTLKDNLTLVAAHRGYWEKFPENSMEAIHEAALRWEIVEADIKPASDGPVVMHDINVQRVTNGYGPLGKYDTARFTSLFLRDRFGFVTNLHPMSAIELFTNYGNDLLQQDSNPKSKGRGYVLALDIKSDVPGTSSWNLIKQTYEKMAEASLKLGIHLGATCIYKIEARSMPRNPADIINLMKNWYNEPLNIVIVLNEDDPENDEVYQSYFENTKNPVRPYIQGWEVTYRYPDNATRKYNDVRRDGSVGTFTTYYDLPEGVGNSKANCCSVLNTDTSIFDASRPLDYRARWNEYVRGFTFGYAFRLFTTDRPDIIVDYLKSNHFRDTTSIESAGR